MTASRKFASMASTVRKTALTISALSITAALSLSACGGVPAGVVAKVDGQEIKQKDFDMWMKSFVTEQSAAQPGASAVVPDAPEFKNCIAETKKAEKKTVKKGEKAPKAKPDSEYKKTCQQQYDQLRDSIVPFLIQPIWTIGEAKDRGVKLTDKQVKASFEKEKKAAFPKDADYKKFLKQKGQTEAQLYSQFRASQYGDALRKKLLEGTDKVTDAQITSYYNKNKAQYTTPGTRDIRVVVTKTSAEAQKALKEIKAGKEFAAVAKDLSIDTATSKSGGKLGAVAKGAQEPALDSAFFSAKKGVLNGPVKASLGYYVFEVTKIVAPKQSSLATVKEQIRQTIVQERQQKVLEKVGKEFTDKWLERTECREGFVVTGVCKNAPKEPKQATPPPKIEGQQGGAQAQPQIQIPAQ